MKISFALYMTPNTATFLADVNEFTQHMSEICADVENPNIDEILIGLIIESEQASTFFKHRKPKYNKVKLNTVDDELETKIGFRQTLSFDCVIPERIFMTREDKKNLLRESLLSGFKELVLPKELSRIDLIAVVKAIKSGNDMVDI